MSLGEALRTIREAKNMSQTELAQKVGVTQAMICQIEKGIKTPSFPVMVEIARVLGCKTDDFI